MKTKREFPQFVITKKGEKWLATGHPWIYEAEVIRLNDMEEDTLENGCIVDAVTENGKYLGSGFYSRHSKIRIRLVSHNANDKFDENFWRRRVAYALDYRMTVMGEDLDAFRLIFGEADGFPGLTVDKFHDLLVTQVLSVGVERIKNTLYSIITDELAKRGLEVKGIFERNDVAIRNLEGLDQYKGWWKADGVDTENPVPITVIEENGVKYEVDVENGQKTGFFLDQKYNRKAVARLAKGKKVLDCFTHTGSFALNAALGGAEHVTAVDVSQRAIDMAYANAKRNQLESRMDFLVADVFDLLPNLLEKGGHPYDFIILDPPAFTKSRKTARNAEKGYKEINYRAMKLLPRGGYLATASCSHFMPHAQFERMLISAAKDAGVELKQIEMRQQAADHPILWNVPETDYLKFYIFQVV